MERLCLHYRPYLSQSAAARLVAAMVISRFDYCNSVFIGLPADQIARLQRVQNNAARLVLKERRRDHVTPLLKELHWTVIWTTFFQFHGTISLEFSAGHSKKCNNTVSIQIAVKNLLVCPGLPVESEEVCVCVWQLNVDGCIWIGRGEREGGGGESMRELGMRRRHGLGG